jgi:hypothetical protein
VTKFDFLSIDRSIVSFVPPSMCWAGPAVMILFGQHLYAVTLDGEADMIAGMSQGENACTLAAALPDGIVYVRPAPDSSIPVSVCSRPIGMMSVLVRGMLALPSARKNQGGYYIDKLKDILTSHDASQGSEALIEALIRNDLSPIAYILATSEIGQHNLPTLKRAGFLAVIGDLRGALAVAEAEYSRLPSADAFHDGTELYRLLQRVLNMAMACGDFAVGERCSELLGRHGTFSAFVDQEGGYAAVVALAKHAKRSGNPDIATALSTLIEKSAKSCIATDESRMPSAAQLRNTRAGIEAYDGSAVDLGKKDQAEIVTTVAPAEKEDGNFGRAEEKRLDALPVRRFIDRLEVLQRDDLEVLKSAIDVDVDAVGVGEDAFQGVGGFPMGGPSQLLTAPGQGEVAGLAAVPSGGLLFGGDGVDSSEPMDLRANADRHGAALRTEANDARLLAQGIGARTRTEVAEMGARGRTQMSAAVEDRGAVLRLHSGNRPDQQAASALQAAVLKMNSGRYPAALREIKRGLKVLGRAHHKDGFSVKLEQVAELVCYLVATELLTARDNVASSPQAATLAGKMTIAQYATALASLILRPEQRLFALLLALNASLDVGNFGYGLRYLSGIHELGVPPVLQQELTAKLALCNSRGGINSVPVLNSRCVSVFSFIPRLGACPRNVN